MGNNEQVLSEGYCEHIEEQYKKVKKDDKRDYLVLSEVLELAPPEDFNVKLSHIGNLYVLDEDKDGRFSMKELVNFGNYCAKNVQNFKTYEFHFQLQVIIHVNI